MVKVSALGLSIRYWLQMLLAAYHDFEDRSALIVTAVLGDESGKLPSIGI